MKTIFAICGVTLLAGAFFLWKATRTPSVYGEFTKATAVPVAELVERPKEYLGKMVRTEGRISEQCQSMGCFFFFHSGGKTLRVELKDIAMTAPMREGRPAKVEGQIVPFSDGYQLYASGIEFECGDYGDRMEIGQLRAWALLRARAEEPAQEARAHGAYGGRRGAGRDRGGLARRVHARVSRGH
ncbi:MAG: hypothetical protein U0Q16_15335 [Bryobacteraceae bacterium]